eukprot:m.142707 g.142707  ORF g.142707 m.142707 type:complete len:468 (+) comp38368_c0_seq3:1212-2615(+)
MQPGESKKLLIFDELDDDNSPELLSKVGGLLSNKHLNNVYALFTCRKTLSKVDAVQLSPSCRFYLQRLFEADVKNLLLRRSGAKDNKDEQEAARLIALEVGGIPQLVDLVANYIKQTQISLQIYYDWIKEEGNLILEDSDDSIRRIYEDTINEAANEPALKELLLVLASCDSQTIPLELFTFGAVGIKQCALQKILEIRKTSGISDSTVTGDGASAVVLTRKLITKYLSRLQKFHVVHYDKKTLWMHKEISKRVLDKAARDWVEKPEEGLAILSSLLKAAFKAFRTDEAGVYKSLIPHASKLLALLNEYSCPLDHYLLLHFGNIASLLGRFSKGKELLLECLRRSESSDDLKTDWQFRGLTLLHLGSVWRRLGQLPDAEKLVSQAIDMWKNHGESKHLISSSIAYAEVLTDAGEYKRAYDLLTSGEGENWAVQLSASGQPHQNVHDRSSYFACVGRAYFGLEGRTLG